MTAGPPQPSRKAALTLAALAVSLGIVAAAALAAGSVSAPWRALVRGDDPAWEPARRVLLDIRLPRILLAAVVGASMGLGGVAAQCIFRNPLASPYVIGVSNGAAAGAALGLLAIGNAASAAVLPMFGLGGGLLAALAVHGLARSESGGTSALLLTGAAVGSFGAAATAMMLYLAGERLASVVFWLMGGMWQASWRDVALLGPAVAVVLLLMQSRASAMDVVLLGERTAGDLGVRVRRLRVGLFAMVAALTSIAVSLTGVIGFVGLLVPHLLRLHLGAGHRALVPASALGGALLLLAADTAARTVAAPAEIPVGVVTSLIGAPAFLAILRRRLREAPLP